MILDRSWYQLFKLPVTLHIFTVEYFYNYYIYKVASACGFLDAPFFSKDIFEGYQ